MIKTDPVNNDHFSLPIMIKTCFNSNIFDFNILDIIAQNGAEVCTLYNWIFVQKFVPSLWGLFPLPLLIILPKITPLPKFVLLKLFPHSKILQNKCLCFMIIKMPRWWFLFPVEIYRDLFCELLSSIKFFFKKLRSFSLKYFFMLKIVFLINLSKFSKLPNVWRLYGRHISKT